MKINIWLASYPRSGNTFFRVILDEVYGIKSNSFPLENRRKKFFQNLIGARVVKTHLLPNQLIPIDNSIPAVYLIRDGRDSLISLAHHRKYMFAPDSDFLENLREVIIAKGDSYFGGWSFHVEQWVKRANIIIRFEDLVKDPVESVEKIRPLLKLPAPKKHKIPPFIDLKYGNRKYISSSVKFGNTSEMPKRREDFFRSGRSGSWKDEMPEELHQLFWEHHGKTMVKMGYTEGMISL